MRRAGLTLLVLLLVPPGRAEFGEWTARLGSTSAEERQFAAELLIAAGEDARQALVAATTSAHPEQRYHAFRLLDRLPPELATLPEAELRKANSQGGGKRYTLTFRNRLAETVKLVWIDFNGGEVLYGTVAPGKDRKQSTMAGHRWLVTDMKNRAVAGFVAIEGEAWAVVE